MLEIHVKRTVFHKFQGDENKFEFRKFIATNARETQSLLVVPHEVKFSLTVFTVSSTGL